MYLEKFLFNCRVIKIPVTICVKSIDVRNILDCNMTHKVSFHLILCESLLYTIQSSLILTE